MVQAEHTELRCNSVMSLKLWVYGTCSRPGNTHMDELLGPINFRCTGPYYLRGGGPKVVCTPLLELQPRSSVACTTPHPHGAPPRHATLIMLHMAA